MKVALVSSTRADFGLQRPILKALEADPNVEYSFFVTGAHLEETWNESQLEIHDANIEIAAYLRIDILSQKSSKQVAIAFGEYFAKFNKLFSAEQFDWLFVFGDRTEMLAIALAAFLNRLPLAHYSGGEVTEGAIDDQVRHCLTKISSVHFVTHPDYRRRVIQLGENPKMVFLTSPLGIADKFDESLVSRSSDLINEISETNIASKRFLVTFHPETASLDPIEITNNFFDSLETIVRRYPNDFFSATFPNQDDGYALILERLADLEKRFKNFSVVSSFGHDRYHARLQVSHAVIGNSSSGIAEAPFFGCWTLNFGNRQKGRVRADSVIDVKSTQEFLIAFDRIYSETPPLLTPADSGLCPEGIISILKELAGKISLSKPFIDINFLTMNDVNSRNRGD